MKNSLRVQRAFKQITQDELAERIGVSRQTIYSMENNRYWPTLILALRIAFFFQKPVQEIFWLEPEDTKDIEPMPENVYK